MSASAICHQLRRAFVSVNNSWALSVRDVRLSSKWLPSYGQQDSLTPMCGLTESGFGSPRLTALWQDMPC